MFERKEIWELTERLEAEKASVLNPKWISAYQNLIDALDRMDATIARSTVQYVASSKALQPSDLEADIKPKEAKMFGEFIKDELEKATVGVAGWTGLKHKLYEKIDGLLVQVENLSQDQIRAFAARERAKLAEDFGEPSPVELQVAPPAMEAQK